jgi:hypothetical protein
MQPLMLLSLVLILSLPGRCAGFVHGTRTVELPELGTVTNWVLQTETATFAFMPPVRWTFEPQPGQPHLVWVAPDYSRITLTAQTEALKKLNPTNQVQLEQYLAGRLGEVKVRDRLRFHTGSESGQAFDLVSSGPGGDARRTRVGIARISGSTFEFTLTAEPAHFSAALPAFNGLLTSFHTVRLRKPD